MSDVDKDSDTPNAVNDSGDSASDGNGGWPSAPASEASARNSGWSAPPTTDAVEATAIELPSSAWPAAPIDPWPAPPGSGLAGRSRNEHVADPPQVVAFTDENGADVGAEIAEAQARAERLLDELRETIASLGRVTLSDVSGVISDLEVALTPPVALQAEDLAALREALQTARERPRDIDTIVDLTRRLDTIAALVIAYDRAIAAIERSLDVLREPARRLDG